MTRHKIAVLLALCLGLAVFFLFGFERYLSIEFLSVSVHAVGKYAQAHAIAAMTAYFVLYVVAAALSLPGAAVLTLGGGALFGLALGTLLISFASTIGATLAFLGSRYLLRDWVVGRFGRRLEAIDAGLARDGAFYLFMLRLVPAFPFFLINLLLGLSRMRTRTFYWVSQLGMLPGTLVYVNAGTQLARIHSLSGILSPGLLGAFAMLGVFPLLAKELVEILRARRAYARWPKPSRFDRNLIVIGGGSAGLVTAYIAAALKAKVTLVEQHAMGGDCLNTGCVPSKALIRSARLLAQIARAGEFGIRSARAEFDFADVMQRVQAVIAAVAPHDSVERYTGLGVDVAQGRARIVSPWEVEITGSDGQVRRLSTRSIVIAAGARPAVPPIPGLDDVGYLTSDTVWRLRELPRRLVVLGGGPIGTELTQAFARLGAQVTQVEMAARILMREDPEVSDMVTRRFQAEGIAVLAGHRARQFVVERGEKILIAEHDGHDLRIPFDAVLVAVGRAANLTGYGLEDLDIPATRVVSTNAFLQTRYPNIYAAGDVAGPFQFTHTAAHQAWYAAVNALFDPFKKFKADYSVIPWATFIEPEIARVGLNELEARELGIAHEITKFDIGELDRAIADGAAHGFVKVLTVPGKDRILGVTIVGEHAAELIAEYILAMKHGIGLNKILGTIHIYPTMTEANKYAAGAWKRAHAPQRVLAWLARFHAWRRGASA
ncbi:pyridine nucleotide-disulfide oxidoreductase [Pandoraea thiooxydans]|uniref:Pyridine nucleotide-disulfide oxidoreductase n=1 Tax=Pandoraea thiooxydans TaxID=445709 RepID=A0A0G3EL20_9BURK|nr:bifunctional TVP38/TMEM64 family protein/FAD-dependent oxidoreductase [Pandoraea thiooxydans]AKJ67660.1 pyridine nucleotide-disulfide oxidoreductase [Pandoraea thiooxydans]APR94777.1 pyridine nucleotide-disulfide oxidoreductase [Pandoraea thiooxydans]